VEDRRCQAVQVKAPFRRRTERIAGDPFGRARVGDFAGETQGRATSSESARPNASPRGNPAWTNAFFDPGEAASGGFPETCRNPGVSDRSRGRWGVWTANPLRAARGPHDGVRRLKRRLVAALVPRRPNRLVPRAEALADGLTIFFRARGLGPQCRPPKARPCGGRKVVPVTPPPRSPRIVRRNHSSARTPFQGARNSKDGRARRVLRRHARAGRPRARRLSTARGPASKKNRADVRRGRASGCSDRIFCRGARCFKAPPGPPGHPHPRWRPPSWKRHRNPASPDFGSWRPVHQARTCVPRKMPWPWVVPPLAAGTYGARGRGPVRWGATAKGTFFADAHLPFEALEKPGTLGAGRAPRFSLLAPPRAIINSSTLGKAKPSFKVGMCSPCCRPDSEIDFRFRGGGASPARAGRLTRNRAAGLCVGRAIQATEEDARGKPPAIWPIRGCPPPWSSLIRRPTRPQILFGDGAQHRGLLFRTTDERSRRDLFGGTDRELRAARRWFGRGITTADAPASQPVFQILRKARR